MYLITSVASCVADCMLQHNSNKLRYLYVEVVSHGLLFPTALLAVGVGDMEHTNVARVGFYFASSDSLVPR